MTSISSIAGTTKPTVVKKRRTKSCTPNMKSSKKQEDSGRSVLLRESGRLRDEIKSAETIKRNAEKVMGESAPAQKRSHGLEV